MHSGNGGTRDRLANSNDVASAVTAIHEVEAARTREPEDPRMRHSSLPGCLLRQGAALESETDEPSLATRAAC